MAFKNTISVISIVISFVSLVCTILFFVINCFQNKKQHNENSQVQLYSFRQVIFNYIQQVLNFTYIAKTEAMLCDSKEGLEDCSVYMRMFTEEQYVNQLEIADKLLESKNLYSYDLSLKIKQFSDRYSILVSKIKVLEMICNGEKASSEEIIEVIQMIINEADNVKNIYCSFKKMLEKETECIVRK